VTVSRTDITVVKLGGSFAGSPYLADWTRALARCGGRAVVVPGGGPFADAVRASQPAIGFDDRAAHEMALLAMDQYAIALAGTRRGFVVAQSLDAIRHVLEAGEVPVWAPSRMVRRLADIPPSWDVTSDSLAVWLAGRLAAARLLLVKQLEPCGAELSARALVAAGAVDAAFATFLAHSDTAASIIGPTRSEAAAAAIREGRPAGVGIGLP
jgi:aspartokinase-like uncharacterized kinase